MGTPINSDFRCFPQIASVWLALALVTLCQAVSPAAVRVDGKLEIRVVDAQTGDPIPVRMRIENSRGRPVRLKQSGLVAIGDSIYFEGQAVLKFRRGQYSFDLDACPEYRTQSGHFEIDRHADDSKTIRMNRYANLESEGWFAGDLALGEIRKNAIDIVMRAEQLHVAPTVDWIPKLAITDKTQLVEVSDRRWHAPLAGVRLESQNDCLLFNAPISSEQVPQGANLVAISPLDRRLPALLATGKLDAIHVIASPEVLGLKGLALRDRDMLRYPGEKGMGRFGEFVYFQMLEAGLRVAPTAGSGWPLNNDLPPGSHRVYVHCGEDCGDDRGDDFTYDDWWEALSLGRSFVTNGPLLRPMVEGQPPGYVFRISGNQELELEIGLQLASREPMDYLEIIRNGQVEFEIRLEEFKERKGKLPRLRFTESGWFLLRVVTANADQYQRAMTAPYFVEKDGKPRVSHQAVQFFLDWIDDASDDPADDALETCRPFWENRLSASTIE